MGSYSKAHVFQLLEALDELDSICKDLGVEGDREPVHHGTIGGTLGRGYSLIFWRHVDICLHSSERSDY